MLYDFHTHTDFSSDSTSSVEEMLHRAGALGLAGICITDHNDFDYPPENGCVMFSLNPDEYIPYLLKFKEEYRGRLEVFVGIEQGLTTVQPQRINDFDKNYRDNVDFIIGSSHMVNGIDPYYKEFWEGKNGNLGVQTYLESILENIRVCHNFDVYGHIDYIIRYIPKSEPTYDYRVHLELYETIFKKLIALGKGIELNTSGFKYGLGMPHPRIELLKLYHDLGGEIITIGSDGHCPEHLAYDFSRVPGILEAAGFKYYTIFRNRKPEFIKP